MRSQLETRRVITYPPEMQPDAITDDVEVIADGVVVYRSKAMNADLQARAAALLERLDDVIELQTPKELKAKPTIDELEKMLNSPSPTPIQIMPDGTVKAAPNYVLETLVEARAILEALPTMWDEALEEAAKLFDPDECTQSGFFISKQIRALKSPPTGKDT